MSNDTDMGFVLLIWGSVFVLGLYGIFHAFNEHSTGLGILTLIIPPLAPVMGIEALMFH